MSRIKVPAMEHGVVRVFALSVSATEAEALRDNFVSPDDEDAPSPQKSALGCTFLDSDFVEVFPVSQTEDMGLAGYLEQGNGIDPKSIEPDLAKLKALDGWVMLVYSSAFGGFAQTLNPAPELTLIGTYSEPGTDWSDATTLQSDAAQGTTAPTRKKPSDAAMSGRVATLALLVMFFITFLMVWIAG